MREKVDRMFLGLYLLLYQRHKHAIHQLTFGQVVPYNNYLADTYERVDGTLLSCRRLNTELGCTLYGLDRDRYLPICLLYHKISHLRSLMPFFGNIPNRADNNLQSTRRHDEARRALVMETSQQATG